MSSSCVQLQLNDLCYWDHVKGELKGSQKNKAERFNKLKLIKQVSIGEYECWPIQGYNKTIRTMRKTIDGWTCDCQWFKKKGLDCSHLLALYLHLKNLGGFS